MTMGTMTVFRAGEPDQHWDTAIPETYAPDSDVVTKFNEIVSEGGSALADGERLKEFDETQPQIDLLPQSAGG